MAHPPLLERDDQTTGAILAPLQPRTVAKSWEDPAGCFGLFDTEQHIPASLIAAVADDRITLAVVADEVKKLEPGIVGGGREGTRQLTCRR
jgi:hypothetical protein